MKANQSSRTAENIAALKAIESARPAGERLCNDCWARFFLSEELARIVESPGLSTKMISHWEAKTPGVCGAVLVRSAFIDRCLEEAIQDGLQQLVILGAGFDTRAFRFEGLKALMGVFELDHPATQAVKMKRLRRHLQGLPRHVSYVGIYFEKESLAGKLVEHGYRPEARTLFIWEGVTYYLPASAVDRTMAFIAGSSGAGSTLVFDYFPSSVAQGNCPLAEAIGLREGLKRFGEEIFFGIDPQGVARFLADRGFNLIESHMAREYRDLQLNLVDTRRSISELFHFVHAAVSPSG